MLSDKDWSGLRVTVMGLGRFGGGLAVTRWLAQRGAKVLVTDKADPDTLAPSLAALADLDLRFRLGEHRDHDFRDADLVVVNPAVPDSSPQIAAAQYAGVPITTELNLFVERCPARCVGVTGSAGKSTTSAMISRVLESTGAAPRVWFGGNIGRSLLGDLERITPDDLVVLELSSFQLQRTPYVRWSPHVAVLTNLAPNHLDWHGTYSAYAAAKLNIVRYQDPASDVVVISDEPSLREPLGLMFGDLAGVWRCALENARPVARMQSSSAVDSDDRFIAWPHGELKLPGEHNLRNAALALTACYALGVNVGDGIATLADFRGLPDRLEFVGQRDGVTYINDSKSTTPESAVMALRAMSGPLLVILGGYDKGADFDDLAQFAARRARFIACVGQTGPRIAAAVREAEGEVTCFAALSEAVTACLARARTGDTVLLSPGCASWDQYTDYRARGAAFREHLRAAGVEIAE